MDRAPRIDKDTVNSALSGRYEEWFRQWVDLKRVGSRLVGLCPIHSENTPSFYVKPDVGIWHCFGCGEGGDVYKLVMLKTGAEFPDALKTVADWAGVSATEPVRSERHRNVPPLSPTPTMAELKEYAVALGKMTPNGDVSYPWLCEVLSGLPMPERIKDDDDPAGRHRAIVQQLAKWRLQTERVTRETRLAGLYRSEDVRRLLREITARQAALHEVLWQVSWKDDQWPVEEEVIKELYAMTPGEVLR